MMSPNIPAAATALAGARLVGANRRQPRRMQLRTLRSPRAYRKADLDGLTVFYREAGDPAAPTILLLHGFPSSSHMFRDLIPLLAADFHLVAPDYPGFGHSDAPGLRHSPTPSTTWPT